MHNPVTVLEDGELLVLVAEHFNADYYKEVYTDVAQAGVAPLEHWLNHGVQERRQISRSLVLRYDKDARRSTDRIWKHYRWRGQDIAARLIEPLPPKVVSQIVKQGRHDPAVLAAGANTIARLTPLERENVHLDVASLQRAIVPAIEFLFVVPSLTATGHNQFAVDLITSLRDAGFRSIHVIVTDEETQQGLIPTPFQTDRVLFWRDFWIEGPEALKLVQLAQLIRILQPRATVVANSRHGREIVARYGRALSEHTSIFCICTDAVQAAQFAEDIRRDRFPVVTFLTDNSGLGASWRKQCADLVERSVTLPWHSPAALVDAVAALFGRP